MTIEQMLDQLAELMAQKDGLGLKKQDLINTILTDEIKAQMAEIEAEFSGPAAEVAQKIADLEAEIKGLAVKEGDTIKGAHLMAVYSKGRVTWNEDILEGMALLIPKILEARKEGKPSISIRKR